MQKVPVEASKEIGGVRLPGKGLLDPTTAADAGQKEIRQVRAAKLLPFDYAKQAGWKILAREREAGSEWLAADGEPFLYDGCTGRVFGVDPRDAGCRNWLGYRYEILYSEPLYANVVAWLQAYCSENARTARIERFSFWDPLEQILWLNAHDGTAWRLDGETVQRVPLGPVMFLDIGGVPVESPEIGPNGELWPALVAQLSYSTDTMTGLTAEDQQNLFKTWILSTSFGQLFKTKPLLLVEGREGSGKTTAIRAVQILITGKARALYISEERKDDFPISLQNSAPISLLDNQDTPQNWLRDQVAVYTTNGEFPRRALYTNAKTMFIKPETFIAVTSRNPTTFRRPDIADRCLVLRLERRTQTVPDATLDAQLEAARPRLYGEWLYYLNRLVARLREPLPVEFNERLAGQAQFTLAAMRAVYENGEADRSTRRLLTAAARERSSLVLEEETVFRSLRQWLEDPANINRVVTISDLYLELGAVAGTNSDKWYASGVTFMRRWTGLLEHVERFYTVKTGWSGPARTYQIGPLAETALLTLPVAPVDVAFSPADVTS